MSKQYETLREVLKELFESGSWGDYQTRSYDMLKQYVEQYHKGYLLAQHYRDKHIISDNIKGQVWFQVQSSSIKSIISQLIDQMRIVHEYCINQDLSKLLNMTVDFNGFKLHVFYFQQTEELISLQIYVSRNNKKNYLAYYIRGRVVAIPSQIKAKINVPELGDLNNLVGINESMIPPEALLNFFLEIILYYDQTETIGSLKLMEHDTRTITEIIEQGEQTFLDS